MNTEGSISKENDNFIIKANVNIDDIPKLKLNDNVKMVVSGLNQSVYGHIAGKVNKIDTDITIPQTSEEGDSRPYFGVEIIPDNKYLVDKAGYKINIFSGMVVESRIEYDRETYFNYFMEMLGVRVR